MVGGLVGQSRNGDIVVSSPGQDQVRFTSDGLRVTLTGAAGTGVTSGLVADLDGEIVCEICAAVAPGDVIWVWMFSTPLLLATHDIAAGDCQLFTIALGTPLDGEGRVSAGPHTLQLTLPTAGGMEAANVGMTVGGPVPTGVQAG
jgi:hypothetical protein